MIHFLALNKIITLVNKNSQSYKNRNALTRQDVAQDHLWNFENRGMNFNKDLNLKGRYCYHPFNTITIDSKGDVYMCVCQAWLPVSVGKIWEFDSFKDIVASAKAREIQASILDGTYRYCDNNTCSIIKSNDLSGRIDHRPDNINWINFALDSSCNLTCPSCRKEFIFCNEGPEFDLRIKAVDHVIKLIEQHNQWIKFSLSGDGDPFASLVYRHLLSNLNVENKEVEIEIITNGILAGAHWHKLKGVWKNIIRTKISFDAGSESVYNITRRGGDWNKLLESAGDVIKWKQKNYSSMTVTANFVVQQANYRDMGNYVELCDQLGFDEINFQRIDNWGTFDNYEHEAVWHNTHPEYADFLICLQDKRLNNKKVNFTNLNDIRDEVKQSS